MLLRPKARVWIGRFGMSITISCLYRVLSFDQQKKNWKLSQPFLYNLCWFMRYRICICKGICYILLKSKNNVFLVALVIFPRISISIIIPSKVFQWEFKMNPKATYRSLCFLERLDANFWLNVAFAGLSSCNKISNHIVQLKNTYSIW